MKLGGDISMIRTGNELAQRIAKLASDKKAEDIKVIDISKVSVIADYFIIAGGNI